ncbi:MAG: GNAT family N-acetyltransferase [Chloroflexota bacterium]
MSVPSPQPTRLTTRRLLLRPPTLSDVDAYYAMASDPEYAYFGSRNVPDRESIEHRLKQIVAMPWQLRPEFAIEWEGRVIGRVTLEIDRANLVAMLGYGVAREHWGLGIASEAASAVLDYAFREFGLERVSARVDPRNVGSVRVLEKIGMRQEGLLRQAVVRWGERADRALYGILRDEWAAEP